jgi:hypothetical protein
MLAGVGQGILTANRTFQAPGDVGAMELPERWPGIDQIATPIHSNRGRAYGFSQVARTRIIGYYDARPTEQACESVY